MYITQILSLTQLWKTATFEESGRDGGHLATLNFSQHLCLLSPVVSEVFPAVRFVTNSSAPSSMAGIAVDAAAAAAVVVAVAVAVVVVAVSLLGAAGAAVLDARSPRNIERIGNVMMFSPALTLIRGLE
jgi:hypothetical protein